jgi:hypothetical protein
MSLFAPSWHESGHALATTYFGLSMQHVSIRATKNSLGRCTIQNGHTVDDLTAAVVMVAGHVAERMARGDDPRPNWFLDDDHDMESARIFIQRACDDELAGRQLVQLRARALLRTKRDALAVLAQRLNRETTLTGSQVAEICKLEGVGLHGQLTKAEAMTRMTPAGRQRLMGTVAADGKTVIEKAVKR